MTWWAWCVVGIAFVFGELITPGGFFLIFFGVSSLIVGLLAAVGAADQLELQLALFSVFAVASLVLFRKKCLSLLSAGSKSGVEVDSLVGEIAVTRSKIDRDTTGQVELRGTTWSARNISDHDLREGERVQVTKVDGLVLHVASI